MRQPPCALSRGTRSATVQARPSGSWDPHLESLLGTVRRVDPSVLPKSAASTHHCPPHTTSRPLPPRGAPPLGSRLTAGFPCPSRGITGKGRLSHPLPRPAGTLCPVLRWPSSSPALSVGHFPHSQFLSFQGTGEAKNIHPQAPPRGGRVTGSRPMRWEPASAGRGFLSPNQVPPGHAPFPICTVEV